MEQKGCIDQACIAINVDKNLTGERSDKMAYKNHEGYPDPTSGQANAEHPLGRITAAA